ncbi:MAG: hypothetical protein WBG01_17770 [Bacteroidota bacterium]
MWITQRHRSSRGDHHIFLILVFLFLLVPRQSDAQNKDFGAGIILGEPTGISAKYWVSTVNALDAGVAWAFTRKGFFHIHADYLWHFPDVIESTERFVLYAGVGGRLGFEDDRTRLGVRIPGGISFWLRGAPIDIFLEVAPILELIPSTKLTGNGGLGIRYFFD